MSHTPGPWELEYDGGEHTIRMGTAITSPNRHQVQHIITYEHGLFADHDSSAAEVAQFVEADANARLIAAAPDLLAALKFILAFYEPGQRYLDTEAWKVAEAQAQSAVAKAEGRSET